MRDEDAPLSRAISGLGMNTRENLQDNASARSQPVVDVSIVLLNWNSAPLVAECIRAIERSGTRCSYEIIVADNHSTDGSQSALGRLEAAHPAVRCVYNRENRGFGAGNNQAIPYCTGRYVLFLNTDTEVLEPLDDLINAADALGERCGAVGGRVLNRDLTLQYSCRERFTLPVLLASYTLAFLGIQTRSVRRQQLRDWDHRTPRDVASLSACYLLIPRQALTRVGGFDPRIFLYFEDTDLCYRIRNAGYVVRYVPVSPIIHFEGGSSRPHHLSPAGLGASVNSARYFARRYLGPIQAGALTATLLLAYLGMMVALAPVAVVSRKARTRLALLWHVIGIMLHGPAPWRTRNV
ncbi:MAG TPA: glycosyltransferase family 2 protein [Ktedonobacterales bacterium]